MAGKVRGELRESVLLWSADLQLHPMDDADVQRRASAGGDAQDGEHHHVHPGRPADAVRQDSRLQRMCEVRHIGGSRAPADIQMEPPPRRRPAPGLRSRQRERLATPSTRMFRWGALYGEKTLTGHETAQRALE